MKGKKNLYFLIPAVCFIWGVIIYRIVDFSSGSENPIVRGIQHSELKNNSAEERFTPSFNYPDPFLKKRPSTGFANSRRRSEEIVSDPLETLQTANPPIKVQYKGYVKDSGVRKRLALLVIEGEEVFLGVGESHHEILLRQVYADSVMVTWQGQSLVIRQSDQ